MRLSYEAVTTSLGPGSRYAIWVQGCERRCKGCINPAGWNKEGGYYKAADDIISSIKNCKGLTGITISGGEPFLQFKELSEIINRIKGETELDIMIYTGFKIEELLEIYGIEFKEIIKKIDIFIDGEYIQEQDTGAMYRGSDNQRIFFFSDKYCKYSEKIISSKSRSFSFKISENGDVYFIGIPPVGFYEEFLKNLGGK
jgi:anaerobic ribonucleoside-triphosphate reductase activating protein